MSQDSEPFQVGFAISVFQNSGDPNTNWGDFDKRRTRLGLPTIRNDDRCGVSTDFWNLYMEDIKRAHDMGANCFRLSLEWSRIEPEIGEIDTNAVQRYHDILDVLLR
jgi:beta-glucosidase